MNKGLFETLREKAVRKKIPIVGHFDLTYRCNLRCIHCYIVAEERSELNTHEVKDILRQFAKAGVLYLTLSGGEILTREDFSNIALYARQLHFALRLLTNGTLINEKTADRIASLSPELVAISVYSTDPKIHDGITGISGSLRQAISTAKMLRKRQVKVKLSSVIMRQNTKDYHSVYKLAKELGASFQADYRITPQTNGDRSPLRCHINDERLRCILSDPIFSMASKPEPEEAYHGVFDSVPCGASHMACYISPYGDVYPCVQLPINCGNLKQKAFAEVWNNSPQMLRVRAVTVSNLLKCSTCSLFSYCRLCIGLNLTEEGSMFVPSERTCKEARIMKTLKRKRR